VKTAWAAVAAVAVIAVAAGAVEYASIRNRLERQTKAIDAQWVIVEAALRERADLIPDFVEAVKGFVTDDARDFPQIAEARAALTAGRTQQQTIQAYGRLEGAFSRLLALTGNNPRLRADRNFRRLLDEIAAAENQIAVERQKYNEALENYNASIQVFPNNFVAAISGFARRGVYFRPSAGPQ
jgi:LemA protein